MEAQYFSIYTSNTISYRKLFNRIVMKYSKENLQTPLNYHEILYLLDQKCLEPNTADRSLAQELFQQAAKTQTATFQTLIHVYIENLETAKICLQRHKHRKTYLHNQLDNLKTSRTTYVYLQMIQASVFSHFSKSPTFTYQINPSSIAPVTVSNALNPCIDNQFMLMLQDTQEFNITFYDSGIQIYRWWFPDKAGLSEGEYLRSIKTQNVKFEVKIKYVPKGKAQQQKYLINQIKMNQEALNISQQAFKKLCYFEPFQNRSSEGKMVEKDNRLIDKIVSFFPFVGEYARNLHLFLLIFVVLSCACSFYSSIEFIDIIIAFYALFILYDLSLTTQMPFLILEIILVLAIIKTIWSLAIAPFYDNSSLRQILVILSIIIKAILILLVGICVLQDDKFKSQKRLYFSQFPGQQLKTNSNKEQENDIWQNSFSESLNN